MDNTTGSSFFGSQIKSLINFAKYPDNNYSEELFAGKLKAFGALYVINLIAVGFLMGILSLTEVFLPEELMEDNKVNQMFNSSSVWFILLMTAVVAPLWEELVFRFPLKFKTWVIHTLCAVFFVYTGVKVAFADNLAIKIAGGVIIVTLLILYSIFIKRVDSYCEKLWQDKFGTVFYIFTALFALIHIANYPLTWVTLLVMPILILPQFTIGIILGYIRVRFGITWSIAFHAIHNALFVTIAALSIAAAFSEPIDIKNKEYSLKISKSDSDDFADLLSKEDKDTIKMINYTFKGSLKLLLDKDEKFIEIEDSYKEGVKLDIVFVNYKKDNLVANRIGWGKQVILKQMQKSYGFTLDTLYKTVPHYDMYIKDSALFAKHKGKAKEVMGSLVKPDSISISNYSPKSIVNILNQEIDGVQFTTAISNDVLYTLNYPVLPLDETQQYFDKHFGIGFKKSLKKEVILKVVFKEESETE